jgi:lipopolysaccharide biosynthesis glycosyltransferase
MANIVFIPNIETGDGRNTPYHYSVKSWSKWSEQYKDIKVVEWTAPIVPVEQMKITLQRYWVHDILKANNIEYDQVLLIDADTIVHPNCPNFFEETEGKFSVVLNNGCYEWTTRSIKNWKESLFPNKDSIEVWKYFNGGFQITSKEHEDFYSYVKEYYQKNHSNILELSSHIKAGTDQTIINFLARDFGVDIKYLPECYNLQDLYRKGTLHLEGDWRPDELIFLNAGWVYHFNAIPKNPRHVSYWMERTFKELYTDV